MMNRTTGALVVSAIVATAVACSTTAKQKVAETTLTTMTRDERTQTFEAMARTLDEHPELVAQMYLVLRNHPHTMHAMLSNTTRDLEENMWLVHMTARLLADDPIALENVQTVAMDYIAERPPARAALRRVMAAKAETATDILTDDAQALPRLVEASLETVEKKPDARRAVLVSVRKNRKRILTLVRQDPELAMEITEQLLREVVKDKPALDKMLRATGFIDDEKPRGAKSK